MKCLGLAFIFISIVSLGFFTANHYIYRLKEIKRVEFLLKNIILCLKKENTTIPMMFKNCSDICDSETSKFLSEILPNKFNNIGALAYENGFCSNKITNLILQEAFSVLGRYPTNEQITEIEFCRKKINELYLKNEEKYISQAKLSRYFGILLGAFFIIILI